MPRKKKQPEPEGNGNGRQSLQIVRQNDRLTAPSIGPTLADKRLSFTRRRMKLFLKAYDASNGNVTESAIFAKIRRNTFYKRWMQGKKPIHAWFRNQIAALDPEGRTIDEAEAAARTLVRALDPQLVKFTLQTKGRKRGWNPSDPAPAPNDFAKAAKIIAREIQARSEEEGTTFIHELELYLQYFRDDIKPEIIEQLEAMR